MDSEECNKVNNFLSEYDVSNLPTCCDPNNKYYHKMICENGSVTELYVEGKVFKDGLLPARIFEMTNIEELRVEHSNIKELPSISSPYNSLQLFNLYENLLTSFPKIIFNFPNLKHLDISENENIKFIPDGLGNLSKLEKLYLGNTGLTCLPKDVYKLSNLVKFDVDNNPKLEVKLYNFGNTIQDCDVINATVTCYNPNTCINFILDERTHESMLASTSKYKPCGDFEKDDGFCTPSSSLTSNLFSTSNNEIKGSNITLIGAFIIIVVIFIIICLILFCLYKRRKGNHAQSNIKEKEENSSILKSIESRNNSLSKFENENNSIILFDRESIQLSNSNEIITSTASDHCINSDTRDKSSSIVESQTQRVPLINITHPEDSLTYSSTFTHSETDVDLTFYSSSKFSSEVHMDSPLVPLDNHNNSLSMISIDHNIDIKVRL
ncbi:L domain-like protein [Neocallimastix californiae]|uniref:L domain-like protein n=1 Tax=Neocallimastix californiae TaxID=1754190 RepID=A0A1Y2ESV2_9FUNG|nr:L domain-like protein [Neocallimastix californiae]|eukprot:ORY74659.1 L domain-like protein [Neocallimastix californiae]